MATMTAAGSSSTTTPTTGSRASTCGTSRPSRSSGPSPMCRETMAPPLSRPTPSTCWRLRVSLFRCPKARTRRSRTTRPKYKGVVAGIAIDPKTGEMSVGWEILMPPFNYDLGDAGKRAERRLGLLDLLQRRAGHRQAGGDLNAEGPGLYRRGELAGGREGDQGRKVQDGRTESR